MPVNNKIVVSACDDDVKALEQIRRSLERICFSYNVHCDIRAFDSPAKLLELEPGEVDILVLDIEMPGMDGFDVASYLRAHGSRTHIIFLTNYREYIQRAFKVRAFRYLFKPFNFEELEEALNAAVNDLLQCDWFYFSTPDRVKHQVYVDEILYIESMGEATVIYTKAGHYNSTQPLYYWLDSFGHHLFKCHRQYLINLRNVKRVDGANVFMAGDIEVPLALRKKSKVKDALQEYVRKHAKYM